MELHAESGRVGKQLQKRKVCQTVSVINLPWVSDENRAGPFSPSMKDWLTMLESSVDSDPSQGLHRQSKFGELNSRAFSRDFPTGKQPAGSSGNQVLHTKHLHDSKQGCQSPSVIAPLSSTSASHCTQGHCTHCLTRAPDNSARKQGWEISNPILQMRKANLRNEASPLSFLIPGQFCSSGLAAASLEALAVIQKWGGRRNKGLNQHFCSEKQGRQFGTASGTTRISGFVRLTHRSPLQVSRAWMKGKLGLVDTWTRAL